MDKKQKTTISPINKKDHKCFQCNMTVALDLEKIKQDPQRITKIKPFINKYSWKQGRMQLLKEVSQNCLTCHAPKKRSKENLQLFDVSHVSYF